MRAMSVWISFSMALFSSVGFAQDAFRVLDDVAEERLTDDDHTEAAASAEPVLQRSDASDAPQQVPVMRQVSAGVSAGTGALVVSLAGAGVAFAHAGLWSLTDVDVGGLVGASFVVLPLAGAAGGAALGAFPFVDPAGLLASMGVATGAAGLGALVGYGVGSVVAGEKAGQAVPAQNELTAVILTATALGAGVGAAVGAGATAPFFAIAEPLEE